MPSAILDEIKPARTQGSLSAAQDQITWILISYIVATAIMTRLAGAFGIKGVFLISVAGFTLTSALCDMAENLPRWCSFACCKGSSAQR
jgi:DHA2 family multidrug resistance protein